MKVQGQVSAIHLHNVISSALGIRRRFDMKYIVTPIAHKVGVTLSLEQRRRVEENRSEVMRSIFYRYASSTSEKALVDRHDIHHALDNWSYVWICIEGLFLAVIVLLISLWLGNTQIIIVSAVFIFIYFLFFFIFHSRARVLIRPQVQAITQHISARNEIEKFLSAV